jgi:multidrug transporter EmrE-like cation transporter
MPAMPLSLNPLLTALASICMSVTAQFLLKLGMSSAKVKAAMAQPFGVAVAGALMTEPYLLAGFVAYGLSAVVWLSVLSKFDVSKAYPLVGLGFALTALIGMFAGEHLSLQRLSGITLICAGVWVVARS